METGKIERSAAAAIIARVETPDRENLAAKIDSLGDDDRIVRRIVDGLLGGPNPGVDRSGTALFDQVRRTIYALATVVDENGASE